MAGEIGNQEPLPEIAGIDDSPEWPRDPSYACLKGLADFAEEQHKSDMRGSVVTFVDDPNPLSQKYGAVISKTFPRPGVYVEAVIYGVTSDSYESGQYVAWQRPIKVTSRFEGEGPSEQELQEQLEDVQIEFGPDEQVAIWKMAEKARLAAWESRKRIGTGKPDNFHAVELAILEEHIDDLARPKHDAESEIHEASEYQDLKEARVDQKALAALRRHEHENPKARRVTQLIKWLQVGDTTYALRMQFSKPFYKSTRRDLLSLDVLAQDLEGMSKTLTYKHKSEDAEFKGDSADELAYKVSDIFKTIDEGKTLDEDGFATIWKYRKHDDIGIYLRQGDEA